MTFEAAVFAFSDRFASERTYQLIVAPALADLQFADDAGRWHQVVNRAAVIRAVAGGLREDLADASGPFAVLTLVPACYFLTMLVLFVDFFASLQGMAVAASLVIVAVLSLGPATICCWPERRSVPRAE